MSITEAILRPRRVLVVCIHYPIASGRYIADALRRAGHDVKTCGPSTGNQIWGIEVDPRHVWKPDYESFFTFGLSRWEPELIIIADSDPVADITEIVEDFMQDVKVVVYGVDNHVRRYPGTGIDHYFLAHHDGPTQSVDESRPDVTWLPCAYDPLHFTPSAIPPPQRMHDVMLIGVPYISRQQAIAALRKAGIKAEILLGAFYEDYALLYHQSKISLCISAAKDVAQRVFETAAMGCAIITDDCYDLERLGLRDTENCLIWRDTGDFDELILLTKGLLENPARLTRLAAAAHEWAKPHTWDARCQVIIERMLGSG